MRRLACLLLLGVMHPALASAPAPQAAADATVPASTDSTPVAEEGPDVAISDAESPPVPQAAAESGTVNSTAVAQGTPAAAGYVPKTPYDNTPYRFDMSQQGKRMSAADFDAWMKARGLRVAGGKPAQTASAEPVAPATPVACQPAPTQAC